MSPHQVLISVHVPKTGGASFRTWLESAFADRVILYDHGDRPLDSASPMNSDSEAFLRDNAHTRLKDGFGVVHGHFWARKYERVVDAVRIAFLRHPVERLVSHYYFWLSGAPVGPETNPLRRRMIEEKMSLRDFARLPQLSGYYTGWYFREVDMCRFDFIGDHARYEDELTRLETLLGRTGQRIRKNENRHSEYAELRASALAPGPLRTELDTLLASDIRFYEMYAGR